ncbi:unnamed protein product [Sympodiomycopsis kandeliae]
MRLKLHVNTATATLLGSLFFLLAMLAHQTKSHNLPDYTANRHALHYRKRASGGGLGGHGGPSNPRPSGSAWHEHPMWKHSALYEGAKLWPSSSESSSKSSTHSPGHSAEITGSEPSAAEVTSHLDKGKAVASGSSADAGADPAVKGQSAQDMSFRKMGRPLGSKDSAPRAPYRKLKEGPRAPGTGRPLGKKDSKARAPYRMKEGPSIPKTGRPPGSKDKQPRTRRTKDELEQEKKGKSSASTIQRRRYWTR